MRLQLTELNNNGTVLVFVAMENKLRSETIKMLLIHWIFLEEKKTSISIDALTRHRVAAVCTIGLHYF